MSGLFNIRSTLIINTYLLAKILNGKPSAEQTQYDIRLKVASFVSQTIYFISHNELDGFLFKVTPLESNAYFYPSVHCWNYSFWMPFSGNVTIFVMASKTGFLTH